MAAQDVNDPPIIITGGSVSVKFDHGQLTSNGGDTHSNASKKVVRVKVERNGTTLLDLGQTDIPDGRVTVTVYYRDPTP